MLSHKNNQEAPAEAWWELTERFDSFESKLDVVIASLATLLKAQALMVGVGNITKEKRMPPAADDLIAKVREKQTVFDGLVAARDELQKKLQEAQASTDMDETNAKIQEAIQMLDAFVDPGAKTSPVTENTPAADNLGAP